MKPYDIVNIFSKYVNVEQTTADLWIQIYKLLSICDKDG